MQLRTRLGPKGSPLRLVLDFYTEPMFMKICKKHFDGNKSRAAREVIQRHTQCNTYDCLAVWAVRRGVTIQRAFEISLYEFKEEKKPKVPVKPKGDMERII